MYGGLLITRSTSPSRLGQRGREVPVVQHAPGPRCAAPPRRTRAMFRSVHCRASGSASTACTRALGTSWAMASAIAPDPAPRSATTGSATSISPSCVDRPPGHDLGLRPGHEHAGPDLKLQVAEVGQPGDVLQRLAGLPPGDVIPEPADRTPCPAPGAASSRDTPCRCAAISSASARGDSTPASASRAVATAISSSSRLIVAGSAELGRCRRRRSAGAVTGHRIRRSCPPGPRRPAR